MSDSERVAAIIQQANGLKGPAAESAAFNYFLGSLSVVTRDEFAGRPFTRSDIISVLERSVAFGLSLKLP